MFTWKRGASLSLLISAHGAYIAVNTEIVNIGGSARIYSPYIVSYGNACIRFYYKIIAGVLKVKLKLGSNSEITLWFRGPTASEGWEKGVHYISKEYVFFRVIFEAKSGDADSAAGIKIALDDAYIGQCEER